MVILQAVHEHTYLVVFTLAYDTASYLRIASQWYLASCDFHVSRHALALAT